MRRFLRRIKFLRKLKPRRKYKGVNYQYRSGEHSSSFPEQAEMLKEKLKNKNRVLTGLPGLTFSESENQALIAMIKKLPAGAVHVGTFRVDPDEYAGFVDRINYKKKYPRYYDFNFPEKTLEHFAAFKLLALKKGDKFVDIAAEHSPHSKEFSRLTGCAGYKQDIMFKPGIHGRKIGGNAANIPVDDSFFNGALTACSIEHFEKDSDIEFMREMSRVLEKGGKVVVIPLYLHRHPHCLTDPRFSLAADVEFDPGIDVYCVETFQNRHGRFYSPETLYERLIVPNLESMKFTLYYIENFKEIDASIYCRFALVGEKK